MSERHSTHLQKLVKIKQDLTSYCENKTVTHAVQPNAQDVNPRCSKSVSSIFYVPCWGNQNELHLRM